MSTGQQSSGNRAARHNLRVPLRWRRRFAVMAGGATGCLARIAIANTVAVWNGWPLGTLLVNLMGSFALGWMLGRLAGGSRPLTITVPLLGVGLIGAFTTFGTFCLELWMLGWTGRWLVAVGYGSVSMVCGLTSAWAGTRLGGRR